MDSKQFKILVHGMRSAQAKKMREKHKPWGSQPSYYLMEKTDQKSRWPHPILWLFACAAWCIFITVLVLWRGL